MTTANTPATIVKSTQVSQGFITKNKSRDAARRKLAKYFNSSIEFLAATMENDEEKTNLRVEAAKVISTKYLEVLREENSDKIRRLELQIAHFGKSEGGEFDATDDDEDDNTPLLQFDTIVEPE